MALRPSTPTREQQVAVRKAAEDQAFFREVDDAVRQDRMSGALRRYGIPIVAAIGIGLVALAGFLWWQHRQTAATERHGEQLVQALDALEGGRSAEAAAALQPLTGDGSAAADALAGLASAGLAEQQGRAADAARQFAALSENTGVPTPLRDLATVREIAANFDAVPPQRIVDRLKPLAVPGNPWFGSAGELLGMAYLKQNRADLAGPLYAAIARDESAPQSIRRRARQLAGVLGVDAVDDVARTLAEAGGAQDGSDAAPQ